MSQYGFVYILRNYYFARDVYKVGCTERSPHSRALELSAGTGIPAPFDVLCFMEVDNFQAVERELHAYLARYRISERREFFEGGLADAIAWMWWRPKSLGFHGASTSRPYVNKSFMRHLVEEGIASIPARGDEDMSLHDLPNPWDPLTGLCTPLEEPPNPLDAMDAMPWEMTDGAPELKVVGGTDL